MKIFLIVLIAVLAFIILSFLAGLFFFTFALDSKSRLHIFNLPRKLKGEELENEKKKQEMNDWIHSNSREFYIQSFDGLSLCAYFIKHETESHKYVVLCHGYGGSPAELLKIGLHYKEHGFNLLFIDQRSYGKSSGRYCTMSAYESYDVKAWAEYLVSMDSNCQIVLHGISMGAASVMNAIGRGLPENVKFVAEDCGFTTLWQEFVWQCHHSFHLPVFPLLFMEALWGKLKGHFSYFNGNCLKSVKKSKIPIIFFHGTEDEVVPFKMQKKLFDAAACPKDRFVAHGAKHTKACSIDPDLYFTVLDRFIKKHISEC